MMGDKGWNGGSFCDHFAPLTNKKGRGFVWRPGALPYSALSGYSTYLLAISAFISTNHLPLSRVKCIVHPG